MMVANHNRMQKTASAEKKDRDGKKSPTPSDSLASRDALSQNRIGYYFVIGINAAKEQIGLYTQNIISASVIHG